MRLFLIGRRGGITHWLEDCANAWRSAGHQVATAFVRDPAIPAPLERALFSRPLGAPLAAAIAASARRFAPDLMIAVGGFHCPPSLLERLATRPGRAPLLAWVGDSFDSDAWEAAGRYDLIGYTDSAFLVDHARLGFAAPAIYLPHAVDPAAACPVTRFAERRPQPVFVGAPTPRRLAALAALPRPVAVYGPGWPALAPHAVERRRIGALQVMALYGRHRVALNIHNELHVLGGLNQRNFAPCLARAALVTDAQADLTRCFEAGREVMAWRDDAELEAACERLATDLPFAEALGEAGRRRVLSEHTFAHRLERLVRAVGAGPTLQRRARRS